VSSRAAGVAIAGALAAKNPSHVQYILVQCLSGHENGRFGGESCHRLSQWAEDTGEVVVIHCPTCPPSGGIVEEGAKVWVLRVLVHIS
jgi:hypothetical protein